MNEVVSEHARWADKPKIGNFSPCATDLSSRMLGLTAARTAEPSNRQEKKSMKRYVIEREIPGASELSEAQLAEIAAEVQRRRGLSGRAVPVDHELCRRRQDLLRPRSR